jgi:hypothetical protein
MKGVFQLFKTATDGKQESVNKDAQGNTHYEPCNN